MVNNRYREEEMEEQGIQEEADVSNTNVSEEQVSEEVQKPEKTKKTSKYKEQIKVLEEKLKEVETEMLKDRAELENFKRRSNEERIKDRIYANQSLLSELIDVIDIFDKAVSAKVEDEVLKKYLMGFSMINMQIQQIMESYGVKKIEALNKPFNSMYHEAIESIDVEGVEKNIVVEVIREGYMFKDRIIRPSMVKVSK